MNINCSVIQLNKKFIKRQSVQNEADIGQVNNSLFHPANILQSGQKSEAQIFGQKRHMYFYSLPFFCSWPSLSCITEGGKRDFSAAW